MARVSEQVEWLNLIDRSGPFIVPVVLEEAFPQGLEKVETPRRQRLRSAYEEWRDAVDEDDPQLSELHSAWVLMVLQEMLEFEDEVLVARDALNGAYAYRAPEHGAEVTPDFLVRGDDGKVRMLIAYWPPETDLEKPVARDPWLASPLERMTLLCRANDVRSGLVTDGERWMVVNAPVGSTSGYAAWMARIWWQEPVTLRAFQSLLGVRRFFGPPDETLDALLERSLSAQEEVTDTLGEQVRRAVEILVQAIGREDQTQNGELLKDVKPAELYEAGLTVMMRLVFTLCAEERKLLLLGDPIYDQNYAISTLRARLREDADRFGVEVLERRNDAWSRILAVFRAIFSGVEHESLRMPALGGSLFDPDRFPFLEGRAKGTTWREHPSIPLPIDNRTAVMLLDALQILEQRGGAQLLSYRALDVEQIGHVYEGLLECTVAKLDEVTVGLIGSRKVRHPSITLRELETMKSQGIEKMAEHLSETTGRSLTAIRNALNRGGDDAALLKLAHACGGDEKLARRLLPFADLITEDSWETMLVYKPGSFAVVRGSSRRETGTHYTPKSLTEPIVQYTLEPLVYVGPAEGKPREEWALKSPEELLSLKICDMAMGSAAFLVQVCRYLGERLVEAWGGAEGAGKFVSIEGVVLTEAGGTELLPKDNSERLLIARRLIASRCIYGVDINPMAVELGKLSLWLITMMRNRPFGFLDHSLKCGDSILGVRSIKQIENFSLRDGEWPATFSTTNIGRLVEQASAKRQELEELPSNDFTQIESKKRIFVEAVAAVAKVNALADCLIAFELQGIEGGSYDRQRVVSASLAEAAMRKPLTEFQSYTSDQLDERRPFHWPVDFPEVFVRGGFDAFVGNPPFMGGKKISGPLGTDYRDYLVKHLAQSRRGNADICAYFFLRANTLLRVDGGMFGLLATNTIAQGDTREVGLDQIIAMGSIIQRAVPSSPWPGDAGLEVAQVWMWRGRWIGGCILGGEPVTGITPFLTSVAAVNGNPFRLKANEAKSFQGSIVLGLGFTLTPDEAQEIFRLNPSCRDVVLPYLNGEDLNSHPKQSPSRWIVNFFDWPLDRSAKGCWKHSSDEQKVEWLRNGRVPNDYPGKVANNYPEALAVVRARVKPERDILGLKKDVSAKGYAKFWWLYARRSVDYYEAIKGQSRVLASCRVTKHLAHTALSVGQVFDGGINLILEIPEIISAVHSTIYERWVREYASTLETRVRYTLTDCFGTFPFPNVQSQLVAAAEDYHACRAAIMLTRKKGLTDIYNRFHDRSEKSEDIARLRELHVKMDQAVAAAYGWNDLELGHGFHETKQGIRYTISELARRTVLDRLLALNHQRYEEEVKAGLHDKKSKKESAAGKNRKKATDDGSSPNLFDREEIE